MSKRLQQGGEVLEIEHLQVVLHCVDQTTLSVLAFHIVARLSGMDYVTNTCAGSRQTQMLQCIFIRSQHVLSAEKCYINSTKFIWRQEKSKSVVWCKIPSISSPKKREN